MKNLAFDFGDLNDFENVAGVDEAGRGPLAGSVFAAAVILNPQNKIAGLNDSKKLSAKKTMGIKTNAPYFLFCLQNKTIPAAV